MKGPIGDSHTYDIGGTHIWFPVPKLSYMAPSRFLSRSQPPKLGIPIFNMILWPSYCVCVCVYINMYVFVRACAVEQYDIIKFM